MSKKKQLEIKKIDAWEVSGKVYAVEEQAKDAQQAYRLEALLKDHLEANLNEQERNTLGWMLLNRMTQLKFIINEFEGKMMKDDEFVDFVDRLKERAQAIEKAHMDQEVETEEKKEELMAEIKQSMAEGKNDPILKKA